LHGPLSDFLPASSDLDEQMRQTAQSKLEALAADVRARGLECEIHLTQDVARGHEPLRHVLVPTDFSQDAQSAARVAHALLSGEGPLRITLLHAYHLPVAYTAYGTVPTAIPFHADVAGVAEERVGEVAGTLQPEGIQVETMARE